MYKKDLKLFRNNIFIILSNMKFLLYNNKVQKNILSVNNIKTVQ